MIKIHKLNFPVNSQREVWNIYYKLKPLRPKTDIKALLQEIHDNFYQYQKSFGNSISSDILSKEAKAAKMNETQLVKLLEQTTDEELRAFLRERIKKMIEEKYLA
jgi:biotin-(acetyl-CoA carboxylase) ligase